MAGASGKRAADEPVPDTHASMRMKTASMKQREIGKFDFLLFFLLSQALHVSWDIGERAEISASKELECVKRQLDQQKRKNQRTG